MRAIAFSLVMSFSLAACAIVPSYEEPISGERAKVRFRTEIERVEIFHSDETQCPSKQNLIAILSQRATSKIPGISSLGMPSYKGGSVGATTEKYVAANKPFSLAFGGSSQIWRYGTKCDQLPFGFTPVAGENYEVTFFHEPNLCLVKVEKIVESNPEEYKREPVAMFRPRLGGECQTSKR